MYYRIMSLLLSVSLLTGGIPATTYESGLTNAAEYEYVMEDTISGNEAEGAISENIVSGNETEDTVSETETEETITGDSASATESEETAMEDMASEVESEETSAEDSLSDNVTEVFTSEENVADETIIKDTMVEAVTNHAVVQGTAENSKGQSLTIDKKEVSAYRTNFHYTFSGTDTSLDDTTFYIKVYYRKTGTTVMWDSNYQRCYQNDSAYISISGLEPETSYDYVIGIASVAGASLDYLDCKIEGTVQTVADDRRISVTAIPGQRYITFYVTLTGKIADQEGTTISFEYKEKGTDSEGKVYEYDTYLNKQGNIRVHKDWEGYRLKPDTEYEYRVWIWGGEQGHNLKTGTFRTQKDSRKIVNVEVQPEYTQAQLKYVVATSYYEIDSHIYLCYKESGTDTWNSDYDWFKPSWNPYSNNNTITGLEPGKTYDYVIMCIDEGEDNNPDNYEEGDRKVSGTFTTKTFNYSLDIKQDMEKQDINSAVLNVMAIGGNKDATLLVSLDVYEQDEQVKTVELVLPETAKYKNSVTISGLSAGKEYSVKKQLFR